MTVSATGNYPHSSCNRHLKILIFGNSEAYKFFISGYSLGDLALSREIYSFGPGLAVVLS
jgi:hypothetical protein